MSKKRKGKKPKRSQISYSKKILTSREGKQFTAYKQKKVFGKAKRIGNEEKLRKVYKEQIRRDFHKFVSAQRKRGRKDFILRIQTSSYQSKKGATTYYGFVRTRITSKKEVDLALDDFIEELVKAMEKYLKRKSSIMFKGVDMEADEEYVKNPTKKARRSKRKKKKAVSRNRH